MKDPEQRSSADDLRQVTPPALSSSVTVMLFIAGNYGHHMEWGRPLYFCPVVSSSFYLLSFFSSPNLSGRRVDVYHTSTHGVALVRF